MIEYTLLNVLILELKVHYVLDKFYGRSKFGQYDKEKNRYPYTSLLEKHVYLYYHQTVRTRIYQMHRF